MHYNQLYQPFKDTIRKALATFLVVKNKTHKHVSRKKINFPGIICL